MISNPTELYLRLKNAELFHNLDEDILLSMLHLCDKTEYEEHTLILPEGTKLSHIYIFLKGVPDGLPQKETPYTWGTESLVTQYRSPVELQAPQGGTHALIIQKSKMISFLNEAPDLLINILKYT